MIEGLILTPLKVFESDLGDVLHGIKNHEESFCGFGEAYFSTVNYRVTKGWKRHSQMTLNLIVPCGTIKFVIYDGRSESRTYSEIFEVNLSKDNYQRLTVPPMLWMAFHGVGEGLNMLLNVANLPHDPLESETINLEGNHIPYNWT